MNKAFARALANSDVHGFASSTLASVKSEVFIHLAQIDIKAASVFLLPVVRVTGNHMARFGQYW